MKVLLLGATGRLGKELVIKLNAEKVNTVALVRDTSKINVSFDYVRFVEGDPNSLDNLKRAIDGCIMVITTLNISRVSDFPWSKLRAPKTLLSDTMRNLILLAKENDVKKIITVSAWGANESKSQLPFWFRWTIDYSNISYGYLDHERQETLLMQSNLDWTIIRPVGLSNSQQAKAAFASVESEVNGYIVSRKSIANFLVENMENEDYNREVVTLS
ncbi:MAG: SDR family oxidoreductase [Bacteroidia bacterium]